MFREEDIKAVQQFKCQKAQLRLYQENIGLIRIIGLQYGVRDMEAYLQDAYIALGDACRLYKWDKSFLACYRVHLKKAVFKHRYEYEYPLRVNYMNCKNVMSSPVSFDIASEEDNYCTVEDMAVLQNVYDIISTLPKMDQNILKMRFFDEMTLKEIAKIYDVSSVTIYNHLTKTLDNIQKRIC